MNRILRQCLTIEKLRKPLYEAYLDAYSCLHINFCEPGANSNHVEQQNSISSNNDDDFVFPAGDLLPGEFSQLCKEFRTTLNERIEFWQSENSSPPYYTASNSNSQKSSSNNSLQNVRAIWVVLPLGMSFLVEEFARVGFTFHHTKPFHLVMARSFEPSAYASDSPMSSAISTTQSIHGTLPHYANHSVGVAGFVIDRNACDHKTRFVLIKEARGSERIKSTWKLPGGLLEDNEDLEKGALREVREETGLDCAFEGILLFRHLVNFRWQNSDLYFVCLMRVRSDTNQTLNPPDKSEIAEAKWFGIDELDKDMSVMLQSVLNAYENHKKDGGVYIQCNKNLFQAAKHSKKSLFDKFKNND